MRLEANLSGGDRVQSALRQLNESINPSMKRKLLEKIGAIYLRYAEERFEKQSSPQRKKWKELKPGTIRKKKQRGSLLAPNHIGVWKGNLVSSLSFRVQGDSVFIGSDVVYAATFQFFVKKGAFGADARGNPLPWGDIPARPFLGRNERADDRVMKMMNQFFSTDIFK